VHRCARHRAIPDRLLRRRRRRRSLIAAPRVEPADRVVSQAVRRSGVPLKGRLLRLPGANRAAHVESSEGAELGPVAVPPLRHQLPGICRETIRMARDER
jgi:hypothetical protein